MAGCASSKKAAAPHPLVGNWTYSVDTPQGVYTGMVKITETDGNLTGTITNDAVPGEMELAGLMFENNKVTFKFDSGDFGMIGFDADVANNQFTGNMIVEGFGEMPVTGKKKMDM